MSRRSVIFLSLLLLLGVSSIATVELRHTRAIPSSNHISVTYRPQETSYYCGPAVVQMALSYIGVSPPSQDKLATEMQTDPVEGVTYTDMMHVPFENRGLKEVYERVLEVNDLKENSYNGYLTIILIYFTETHEYQHYVLVTGYNATGILVHDPWPVSWGQPTSRRTGANVFISNELIADLWDCEPSHWGLVIQYTEKSATLQPWWQQHWYTFLLIPAAIGGVLLIAVYKRRKAQDENLK